MERVRGHIAEEKGSRRAWSDPDLRHVCATGDFYKHFATIIYIMQAQTGQQYLVFETGNQRFATPALA